MERRVIEVESRLRDEPAAIDDINFTAGTSFFFQTKIGSIFLILFQKNVIIFM
jgi:hypothetical protein